MKKQNSIVNMYLKIMLWVVLGLVGLRTAYIYGSADDSRALVAKNFINNEPTMFRNNMDTMAGFVVKDAEEFAPGQYAVKTAYVYSDDLSTTNFLICLTGDKGLRKGDNILIQIWRSGRSFNNMDYSIRGLPIATKIFLEGATMK